jgi:hypothetical protein
MINVPLSKDVGEIASATPKAIPALGDVVQI